MLMEPCLVKHKVRPILVVRLDSFVARKYTSLSFTSATTFPNTGPGPSTTIHTNLHPRFCSVLNADS